MLESATSIDMRVEPPTASLIVSKDLPLASLTSSSHLSPCLLLNMRVATLPMPSEWRTLWMPSPYLLRMYPSSVLARLES